MLIEIERSTPLDPDDQIAAVASIAEPQRRNLYRYVLASENPVSKDEAARALGLSRSVATFHLDRLVADGLLVAEYRRLSGRQGPGAGRPAKLYRRTDQEISVSLPERRYGLAAQLLAAAVGAASRSDVPVDRALSRAARRHGRTLGQATIERAGPDAGPDALMEALLAELEDQGYEPRPGPAEIVLVNCPFHALADQHRELVCGMNLDLLDGLAAVLPAGTVRPRLDPSETACCVRLSTTKG